MSDQDETEPAQVEWDARWVRIREMDMGGHDEFNEFAEEVYAAMAEKGNEVGRPLVMKVTVEVADRQLAEPEKEADSDA